MPKLEAIIERMEITPGVFKRQPFDYSSNESGIGLAALRMEWPIVIEVEHEGLDGVEEAVQQLLDRLGDKAYNLAIRLLEKDKELPLTDEEEKEEYPPF